MILANAPTELRAVSSITVARESRQRSSLDKDVSVLAEQMAKAGQIQPIVIHADGRLVAGERRLTAARSLGWAEIKCTVVEKLSAEQAFLIELLENIARKELSWQDTAKAILHYHKLRVEAIPEWNIKATGGDIGLSQTSISIYLRVADRLSDPEVAGCPSLQGAFNLLRGRADRAMAAASNRGLQLAQVLPTALASVKGTKEEKTAALGSLLDEVDLEAVVPDADAEMFDILDAGAIAEASLKHAAEQEVLGNRESPIITADFCEWIETYAGPQFDVLHLDFPWGKNYSGSNTRRTGKAHIAPRYKDDPDVFWTLLATFLEAQDRIAYPIAHCVCWFNMPFYQSIIESFETAGWQLVQPFPLIWTKPYQGVASDPKRRPRHCYEPALLFSRGDRRLVKLDQDYFEGRADEKLHLNQKPVKMLRHFLSMLVDEHSAVFDPTCGSGTALAAARALGAKRVLGLELDESNAEVARFVLDRPVLIEETE